MVHIIREGKERILFLSNRLEFYKINERTEGVIDAIQQNVSTNVIETKYNMSSESIESVMGILKRDKQLAPIVGEYPYLRKLILNVSNSCNLNCSYCYANGGNYASEDRLMDKQTAQNTLDKFIDIFGEIKYIQFFGGEPLLNYSVIKFVCEYVSELYDAQRIHIMPQFGIVTNGTIINDGILEILSNYHVSVTISCDGPQKINDHLRMNFKQQGVYSKVATNIRILEKKAKITPNIEVTYTRYHHDNDLKIPELLDFFYREFSIKNVHIVPVSLKKTHKLSLLDYDDFLESVSEETIKQNKLTFTVKNLIYNLQHRCGDCKICGAGVDIFSVGVDGQVYPCFMMTDRDDYVLTNTKKGKSIFQQNIDSARKKYNFNRITNPSCKGCFNNLLCNGCMGRNVFETGNPFACAENQCKFLRGLTEKLILELAKC